MLKSLFSCFQARPYQAPKPAPVDFSAIDTPTEALLLPWADTIVSLVVAPSPSGNAVVHTEVNGQSLDYTTKTTTTGLEIGGSLNGEPFTCTSTVNREAGSIQVCGTTRGGPIAETLENIAGGMRISGKLGTIAFDQTFHDDLAAPEGRKPLFQPLFQRVGAAREQAGPLHLGDVDGTFGGQVMHQALNVSADGETMLISGNLGDAAISGTLTVGADGTMILDRNIGGQAVHQTITPI